MRSRLAGLFALFGVLLGAFTLPQAAQAADFSGWIASGHDPYIDIGGAAAIITVEVQADHQNPAGMDAVVTASLSGVEGYATVDVQEGGSCYRSGTAQATCPAMASGSRAQIQFVVAPAAESDLPEGETRTGEFKVDFGGGSNAKTSVTVAGHAPAGPTSVSSVDGQILSNAEPVSGAKVVLTDGDGTDHETTTDDGGNFAFAGSDNGTFIAPGDMTLTVTKDGFEKLESDLSVGEGSSSTQNLTLVPVQAEEEQTTEAPPSESAQEPSPSDTGTADEGGISGTLIFLIIIGALLVIGGIVGIVFLLRGGKDDKDDDESFADSPLEHTPTAAQVGSPGVYQAGPAPGGDAPTMIHNGPLVNDNEVGAYGAPTAGFGPAYGPGSDTTQVMPQAGGPGVPPAVGPNDTQILQTVKGPGGRPGGPSADSTQVMPQATPPGTPPGTPPPPSAFGDADQSYGSHASPGGATRPHPSPTPPPAGGPSPMFEPQRPNPPSQPPVSRDPYAPPPEPSQPPATEAYPSAGLSRDPYAPPQQPSAPPPDQYGSTQPMPQSGYTPQNPAAPYGTEPPPAEGEGGRRRREDEERKGWGEWDDRPRSW